MRKKIIKPLLRKSLAYTLLAVVITCYTHSVNSLSRDTVWNLTNNICFMLKNNELCTPTPISNSDAEGGIIKLSNPDYYCLTEPITNKIVISSSDVTLKMNGYKVEHNLQNQHIITIESNLENIRIFGGAVQNSSETRGSEAGILIKHGTSKVSLGNLSIFDCGNGVRLDGIDGNEVIDCDLVALDLVSNTTGIVFNHADHNTVKNCTAAHCTQVGFELLNSKRNCLTECKALETFGNDTVSGFRSSAGISNLFEGCITKKTKTSAREFCKKAYGFLLTGTEQKTKIIDCIINETDVTSTVSAIAYGIHLDPILLKGGDLLDDVQNLTVSDAKLLGVKWSPNNQYLVTGDSIGSSVRVFSFNGKDLTQLHINDTPVSSVYAVAWSPDGRYVASGEQGTNVCVFGFDGSKLSHIAVDGTPSLSINSIAWSPNGKYIASGNHDNIDVFSFDNPSLNHLSRYTIHGIYSIAWSPDGNYIVSGENGNLRVLSFDGSSLAHLDDYPTPTDMFISVEWSPNGTYIAALDQTGRLYIFSFDGKFLHHISNTPPSPLITLSISWAPNGKYIALNNENGGLRIFSFTGYSLSEIAYKTGIHSESISAVDWSSDGTYLAMSVGIESNGFIYIYSAMYGPQHCLIDNCTVCDTAAHGQFVGTGVTTGGNNHVIRTACCGNEVNFSYGVPNVYYGSHNTKRPFDNVSVPTFF